MKSETGDSTLTNFPLTAERAPVLSRYLVLVAALWVAGLHGLPAFAQPVHTSSSPLPAGSITVPYLFTFAATGGTPGYTWAITAGAVPNLSLDAGTGELTGTPLTSGIFQITVRVTDSMGLPALKDFVVPINSGPLTITTVPPLPSGTVGTAYSTTLTAQGGAGPRTWSVAAGTVPTGLAFTAGGVLSGIPAAAGRFFFDAHVRDAFASEATRTMSALMIGCPSGSAVAGSGYSSAVQIGQVPANTGFHVFAGSLPSGLTLNSTTGGVSGTPTQTGQFGVTYEIADASTSSVWFATCAMNVAPAFTLSCPATSGAIGAPYSSAIVAGGALPPYSSYGLAAGSGPLPQGIGLNAASGALAGTPTQSGAFPVVFSALDSIGTPVTASCSILIAAPPPTLACPAATAQVNSPYLSALAPSGVSPFTAFAVASGSLPPGLSLNSVTGSVFGSPTRHGVFQTGFSVRDGNSVQGSRDCTFTVTPAPLALACPSGFAAMNSFYGSSAGATGGVSPYTFSLLAGALPPGLTFSPANGAIAGTPEAPGDFPLRFRVTDQTQTAAEGACRITVEGPTTSLRATGLCSSIPFPMGSPIRIPLNASGGAGGYSFRVLSPSWMRSEDNQGIFTAVGTPPEPGVYAISVAVTDDEGKQATFNCSIRVLPPLALTASCPTNPIPTGTPFSIPMAIRGGQPPYTWRLSGPEWLKFAAQYGSVNELFGTPPAPGNATFTVTVTDSINSLTASFTCTILVPPANLMITTPGCPVTRLPALQPFQQNFAASGGAPGFTWSLSGPPWLGLSRTEGASTSLSGTVPDSGGVFPFTLTLRDASGTATTSFSCELDTIPALSIRGSLPAFLTQGESFSANLEGAGGQPPYHWSVAGPGFVSLNPNTGSLVVLAGTPPNTDPFSCSVTLNDDAGSVPASLNCSAPVRPPVLRIDSPAGSCPANPIIVTRPFSATLNAVGGDGTYRWSLLGPAWLTANLLTGRSVTLSGTPDQPGSFDVQVSLTDGAGVAAEPFRCRVAVDLPAIPTISIVGLALGGDILQEITVGLQLSAPAPIRMEVDIQLGFESAGFGAADNPQVQFAEPAATGGGRRFRFTIEPGQTLTSLARIRPGTVAGAIRVRVVSVIAAGREALGPDGPTRDAIVPRLRPVITDFQFADETATGFTLAITGYSTPRDMISGLVTFNPRQGATLTGPASFTVQLSDYFRTYYSGAASQIGGSTFVLRIPVTVDGNKSDIGSVSVRLTNSVGDSDTATLNR